MNEKFSRILSDIVNPVTGDTLLKEKRWVSFEEHEGQLVLQYRRDGISPEQKRQIEKSILKAMEGHWPLEKIKICTVSERSEDVYKNLQNKTATPNVPDTKQAQLKVGHGTTQQKRSIDGVKKIIAVASGKGGVGKSTFSVNLAKSLQVLGYKVGILDADIYGPSLPKMMNSQGKKPYANDAKKILPLEMFDLKFISFGLFIEEDSPVIWRGPMLGGVLNQFMFDVDWGALDFLIVDLPPGTGDVQLSMVQNCNLDGAIIICTPQDIALLDAVKGLAMMQKMNVPIIGMVENMSSFVCDGCGKEHYLFGKDGVRACTKKLGVPYLGSIPLTLELRLSADEGTPFMSQEKFKKTTTWNNYLEIASGVAKVI
jgi:ATP-binding protein involved in chromosome partitioning